LLAIGCALMAVTSPPLAVLVVVMIFLTVGPQVLLGPVLERSFDRVQQQLAYLAAYAQEHLTAQRMLAAYAQEQPAVARFKALNDTLAQRNLDFVLRSSAIAPLPSLVVRLAAALVVGFGGVMIINGELAIGQYVQFIVYLGLLSGAAQSLSQAFERQRRRRAYWRGATARARYRRHRRGRQPTLARQHPLRRCRCTRRRHRPLEPAPC
ncbi:MAG TPA: ABC transporter transmembrane domain-containing protein, partial [Roseiflexaceae bacterium]|nr:ABC transporter transmembrane domain-containing protein [Roseiflexaceae bacterium]